MAKSVQIINPGTEYQGSIVLYNYAFTEKYNLNRVVVHELAHEWYAEASKKEKESYERELNWKRDLNGRAELSNRAVLNAEAKDSPEEDFAVNVENYLFEANLLKSNVPSAYEWIQKHFSKDFQLKGECNAQGN